MYSYHKELCPPLYGHLRIVRKKRKIDLITSFLFAAEPFLGKYLYNICTNNIYTSTTCSRQRVNPISLKWGLLRPHRDESVDHFQIGCMQMSIFLAVIGRRYHPNIGPWVCDGLIQTHTVMKQHCMGGSWYAFFTGYGGLKDPIYAFIYNGSLFCLREFRVNEGVYSFPKSNFQVYNFAHKPVLKIPIARSPQASVLPFCDIAGVHEI